MKILITGGASGLGKAIITKLLNEGYKEILFTYNNSHMEAENLMKEYPSAKGYKCDFRSKKDLKKLKIIINDEKIDALINNSYNVLFKEKHFHKSDLKLNCLSFNTNISSVLELTQAAIKVFRKKNFGKIITILSSTLVDKPPIGLSLYVAEKNYLLSMVKSWAVENSKYNISSNAVSPGFMLTNFHKSKDPRIIEQIVANFKGKLLKVEEVASVIKFLLETTQKINGQNIVINNAEHVI